jgi:hypothetical protein
MRFRSRQTISLSVRTSRAEGEKLPWVRNGSVFSSSRLSDGETETLDVKPQPGDWFSVVLRDARGATLFSNAILYRTLRREATQLLYGEGCFWASGVNL